VFITRGTDVVATRRLLDDLADHPDPWVRAARYTFTALLELNAANPETAEQLLLTSNARFRELGERQGLLLTLVILTEFALAKGEFQTAVIRAEQAYGHATDGMSTESGSMLLIRVGQARSCAGEIEQGRRMMEQATRTAERCGELSDAAVGHAQLAALAFKVDDLAEARRQLAAATELIEGRSDRPDASMARSATLAGRGYLATLEGDFEIARDCYRQAIDAVWDGPFLSFMSGVDEMLRGLAALAGAEGDHVRAAELLGAAFALTGMENKASYADPRTRAAAITALGEDAFNAAFTRGRRLPKSEILALER
jgi:tetratricopeptide (TPR) repeat protein